LWLLCCCLLWGSLISTKHQSGWCCHSQYITTEKVAAFVDYICLHKIFWYSQRTLSQETPVSGDQRQQTSVLVNLVSSGEYAFWLISWQSSYIHHTPISEICK